jgi:hypothetical protein
MPADRLERLWNTSVRGAQVPHLVGPLQGVHEHLLPMWRSWSASRLGRSIAAEVGGLLDGNPAYQDRQQWARVVGIVLWEREMDRGVDIYACTQAPRD